MAPTSSQEATEEVSSKRLVGSRSGLLFKAAKAASSNPVSFASANTLASLAISMADQVGLDILLTKSTARWEHLTYARVIATAVLKTILPQAKTC